MNFWSQRKTSLHTDDQTQSLDIREIRDVRFAQPWKKSRSELAHLGPTTSIIEQLKKKILPLPFLVLIKTLRSRFFRYFPETTNAKK